ncbi:MAG: DUF998 domain-containing protein [Candidatus Thorarchaeota archaeon]
MSTVYQKIDAFYGRLNGSYYGIMAVVTSVVSLVFAILLYVGIDPSFSFLTHYLSTIGASPTVAGLVYTLGMLITNLFRVLFALFIIRFFQLKGSGKKITWTVFGISVITSIGWGINTFVPYTLSLMLHISSIMVYFFGSIISQMLIVGIELKNPGIPNYLAVFGFIVITTFLAFFVLEIAVFTSMMTDKTLSVISEWLAYLSIIVWVTVHSIYTKNAI